MTFTVTYHGNWKRWETCSQFSRHKRVCYTHKKLKQALNHGLILKKGQRVIKFNIKNWLKSCIGMTIELRKNALNGFEKTFFRLMNYAVFGKTKKNLRIPRKVKCWNQSTIQTILFRKFIIHWNEKNTNIHEQNSLVRSFNTGNK